MFHTSYGEFDICIANTTHISVDCSQKEFVCFALTYFFIYLILIMKQVTCNLY